MFIVIVNDYKEEFRRNDIQNYVIPTELGLKIYGKFYKHYVPTELKNL